MMQEQSADPAKQYWVIGGVYTGTDFKQISASSTDAEERFGPYASYAEAFSEWSRLAWKTVDDAHARYRIVKAA